MSCESQEFNQFYEKHEWLTVKKIVERHRTVDCFFIRLKHIHMSSNCTVPGQGLDLSTRVCLHGKLFEMLRADYQQEVPR